jgi:hypothetical protein
LLEIDLKILLRKTGARLIFKIAFISVHIDSGAPIKVWLVLQTNALLSLFISFACNENLKNHRPLDLSGRKR